ncbi:MAG: MFS transporter [Proteobacteria bacterium]|nr:MFS transporter [Pseudomonadota bacterium]
MSDPIITSTGEKQEPEELKSSGEHAVSGVSSKVKKKQENPLFSLIFNVAIPSLILSKLSADEHLGPVWGLVVALAFPICYSLWDILYRKDVSLIAILGLVNVLLTGGFGLMKLDGLYFAIKEASIPTVLGIVVYVSTRRKNMVIRKLFVNDYIMNVSRIQQALQAKGCAQDFDKLLKRFGRYVTMSFALSAVLNFLLAYFILRSPTSTDAFNEELALMTLLSYPVIVLPALTVMGVSMFHFFRSITQLTGLKMEDIMAHKAIPKKHPS